MVNQNISKAMKARHASTPPEVLRERMRHASRAKWDRIGKEERRDLAVKMVLARIDKKYGDG